MGMHKFVSAAGHDYSDYSGTSAADLRNPLVGDRSLEERLGLSADDWSIVGYNIIAVGHGMAAITVYALDLRGEIANMDYDALQLFAEERGGMPVTEIRVQNWVELDSFITQNFKSFSVTLAHRSTERRGHPLDVVSQIEVDYQPD